MLNQQTLKISCPYCQSKNITSLTIATDNEIIAKFFFCRKCGRFFEAEESEKA
mgnify:CR=1 FL=1